MSSELYYRMINPRSYYEKLADSADLHDNIQLTSDPHCPPDILDRYCDDLSLRVAYSVASNPNTSKETFIKMYNYKARNITSLIIHNKSCPLELLEKESFNQPAHVCSSKSCPENLKMSNKNYLWLSY